VYAPSAVVVYACGDAHTAYVPAPAGVSSLHSNVAPGSEENVNDWLVADVVPVGPPVIAVSGAVASTVNEREAGDASGVPNPSVARTENVYEPSASGPYARGDVHATHVPVADPGPSSLHSNVDPVSEPEKPNDGDALPVVPVGPESLVVSGAAVSTVNERVAGLGSGVPVGSVARTENVYEPSASGPYAFGDVQAA
jgi:hypothetical protein